jgi:hypothetical protein
MLKVLTSARFARFAFPLLILGAYAFLPVILHLSGVANEYFLKLAWLSCVGVLCIYIGVLLPVPLDRLPKVILNPEPFLFAIFVLFSTFVLLACLTATQIPLIASLRGADAATIALLREQFLKAREGYQASFVYINAIFSGFLIPYSLALMFLNRYRFRWVCFAAFLLYTISFSEKVFFLKAVLPLFYLIIQKRIHSILGPSAMVACMAGLLFPVTAVSAVTAVSRLGSLDNPGGQFFSAQYIPNSPTEYMIWRAFSIPLVTAADAIRVFSEEFDDEPFKGATSTLLAKATDRELVPFERKVFAAQWGQNETGTGSSNSVYLTEAYVNFGVPGVVVFSIVVGIILRFFARTRDIAFQSLWMLFALNVYVAGLIGTLMSNGLIVMLFLAAFVKFKADSATVRDAMQIEGIEHHQSPRDSTR